VIDKESRKPNKDAAELLVYKYVYLYWPTSIILDFKKRIMWNICDVRFQETDAAFHVNEIMALCYY
jgi:hypothetical protein